jgi:hypothetical protein
VRVTGRTRPGDWPRQRRRVHLQRANRPACHANNLKVDVPVGRAERIQEALIFRPFGALAAQGNLPLVPRQQSFHQ